MPVDLDNRLGITALEAHDLTFQDITVVKGLAFHIEVTVMTELSSDHCPIQVHEATRYTIGRKLDEWSSSLLSIKAFPRRFPSTLSTTSMRHAKFDKAVSLPTSCAHE